MPLLYKKFLPLFLLLSVLVISSALASGCASSNGGTMIHPPPEIIVTIIAPANSVLLGNTLGYNATVSNSADTAVTWSVNGIAGGSTAFGFINSSGLYTAPADLPSPAAVQITATAHANPAKSASAPLTIASDLALSLTPNAAAIELGATQHFNATLASNGHPDSSIRWTISGLACPIACGAIDSSGNFTSPQILPPSTTVTVTAQSVADPSKQISASILVTSNFSLQISAPSSVATGTTSTVVATLTPAPNSNPSTKLSWSLSGSGCSGASCGVLSVVTTQSAGGNAVANSATFTAPVSAPTPDTVTITVTPLADPSKAAQATLAILPGGAINLSPPTFTLAANHRITLTATVSGLLNDSVTWTVNGVAGGNNFLGQICLVGSSPCVPVNTGNILTVDFLAPSTIPTPDPVSVQVTSNSDPTKIATSQITVINHVLVSVLPGNVTLAPLAVQAFTAAVLGSTNQTVVWQVQGSGCAAQNSCGAITQSGAFTAPASAPAPDSIQIVAISSDDLAQSGFANVSISTGANILTLQPASVYAGAALGFTVRVSGTGFAPSSPGPGSTLIIGTTPRTTSCADTMQCTAPVTPADVATIGSLSVQIQNPDGKRSNSVALVVAAPNISDDAIPLTSATPIANAKDIVVVDPTTAGVSLPGFSLDINVAALGIFSTTNNSCTLGGNPISATRPATGNSSFDICLFSESGFDTSMDYTITGPGDVAVIAKQPAGLGIIHLTIQISASAVPGARTLFIQNANLDKTAASGTLEVY